MTGAIVRWHQADGTPVAFQDCRPEAKATEPEPLTLPSSREVAGHEARHAAAALLLGIPVVEVRADWPDPFGAQAHVVGYVRYAAGSDRNTLKARRKSALVSLVGDMSTHRDPEAVGYTGQWPPTWPPINRLGTDSNEAVLAQYVETAGLGEADWKTLCAEAHRLAAMSEFKQLTSVIETLLEHGTVLDGRMLKHVLAQVLRHSFEETRRQVDQLGAEVRQLAREFDCRELDRAEAERFLKSWFGR